MNRADYPDNWEELSHYVRFVRAGGCCEGSPLYPDCRAEHGRPHPETGSMVVLTTAHLDHDTTNNDLDNLRAMCQLCHLSYDAPYHAANAAQTRRQRQIDAGQLELWDLWPEK
jgi:hypothetical protein